MIDAPPGLIEYGTLLFVHGDAPNLHESWSNKNASLRLHRHTYSVPIAASTSMLVIPGSEGISLVLFTSKAATAAAPKAAKKRQERRMLLWRRAVRAVRAHTQSAKCAIF